MWVDLLPEESQILDHGRRIVQDNDGDRAVLLVHGWTGWTGRVAFLAQLLFDAGFAVCAPRLPGHGTNVADLLTTGARDWLRCVLDEYLNLRHRYREVHIVGHSMGGILAGLVASTFEADRVAMLAPAYLNRNRIILLAPLLRRIVPRVRAGWRPEKESDERDRKLGLIYSTYDYTTMAAELLKVQRWGRRRLPSLRSRTLVVVSEADESVPADVARYVGERSNASEFRELLVKRSNHQLPQHLDRQEVADAVVDWFTRP